MPDVSHEAAVKAFLAEAQSRDPQRFAAVCSRYPVLSERQLVRRASKELPLSPSESEDKTDRARTGNQLRRPGNRSPEFWAAYYGFELKEKR